ncbi:mini-MOMP protein [Campylobacter sp.]|uniref:mini-MOMP protein n=1 Tax=Campylobacter sp. TaxID=205 RepID=UPI0025C698DA|nr:mini-MOMP protein [Campylobacter sp.]
MKNLYIVLFILVSMLFSILNSAPLDEIFQDVNVSGSVRYRFEHNNPKNKNKSNLRQRIQMH